MIPHADGSQSQHCRQQSGVLPPTQLRGPAGAWAKHAGRPGRVPCLPQQHLHQVRCTCPPTVVPATPEKPWSHGVRTIRLGSVPPDAPQYMSESRPAGARCRGTRASAVKSTRPEKRTKTSLAWQPTRSGSSAHSAGEQRPPHPVRSMPLAAATSARLDLHSWAGTWRRRVTAATTCGAAAR